MKRIFVVSLLTVLSQLASAQTGKSTGTVKDDKGAPLHFVFVADAAAKNATFTDSLGNFSITAATGSKLQFQAQGYKDTVIDVAGNGDLQVVLKPGGAGAAATGVQSSISIQATRASEDVSEVLKAGGLLMVHQKGLIHGNKYLLFDFARGFIVNSSNEMIYNPNYRFNYDKMEGGLLLTQDQKNATYVSWDQTKAFTIFSNKDECFAFERVPAIDNSHYVQVLASGKKYKIYKLIKTKFIKSNYVNTGIASHGNDYDEYVDDADYFVFDVQGNQNKKLSLRKKSIKEDFAKDADKVNKFLSDNSGDYDDAYLSKLGDYMNQ